ncbi:MAG: DUF393 domain-containing protein [Polyangiaceae bacterium]|nr:DUF393 domain-containing protein [Polyangiaceae bacterium]
MLKALRNHFFRIDARSLGLFRILFGLVLLGDLVRRWAWLRDFYSNEGVLPNHNHIFNLVQLGTPDVWSVYHAFSTPGENHFAFILTLFVYIAFLIGIKTRVFHALSLVCLVSLTGRNILLENPGNHAAIAVLAFTLFLPCGSRFSIDSLRAAMKAREEKSHADLNDRTPAGEAAIEAERLPGFSPVSLAAFATLTQIAVIFACSGLHKSTAPWKDGSALYYALHVERWVTDIGLLVRSAPGGLLRALTYLLYVAEWAVPILIVLPLARRAARESAALLMLVYGLLFGLLFSFGLFGWTLVAAAPLLLLGESWDAYQKNWKASRARTVIYDADCGICLLISRALKRMDIRGHLTFQGNDETSSLLVRRGGGAPVTSEPFPKDVPPESLLTTVVVIDQKGRVYTRGRAVAETLRSLPFGHLLAIPFLIPGISHIIDILYDRIAVNRHNISASLGLGACGLTPPPSPEIKLGAEAAPVVAPWTRIKRLLSGSIREIAALAIFAAMLAQTAKENPVPPSLAIPQGKTLAAIAVWPRMLAKWDLLATPPAEDTAFVVDAQTKANVSVDPLTGKAPVFEPHQRRGLGMGQLWNDYLERIRKSEWQLFQRAFRDYLVKGYPKYRPEPADPITGYDAYWVTSPIPPPGQPKPSGDEAKREKLFTHSRGGRLQTERVQPVIRPDAKRPAPVPPPPPKPQP